MFMQLETHLPSGPRAPGSRHWPLRILRNLIHHPDYSILEDPHYFQEEGVPLHSPLLIPGMEEAVKLLQEVVERKGEILILGDRDADGVTSTALLGSFLQKNHQEQGGGLTLQVSDEGDDYGLVGERLLSIRENRPDLVILLDMGSAHGEQIRSLLDQGCGVIVLDHHTIQSPPPPDPRCAFVNPLLVEAPLEHEGKVATAALVFKFLLAYVLGHTKDWERGYYVVFPEMAASSSLTGPGYLYRCGLYMGRFESAREAEQEFCQGSPGRELQVVELSSHPLFQMEHSEREWLKKNPLQGGKMILARQILARSRLRAFVEEIADLAAVGLITDMMPLVGENRTLVRLGTGRLRSNPGEPRSLRRGYEALLKALKVNPERITGKDLGWSVGPAINAAGRMGRTVLALDLLLSRGESEAKANAKELLRLNEERRERTRFNEALLGELLPEDSAPEAPLLFCYHPDLKPGVSGIMATRLLERYGCPVVYINQEGERARGSIRTPEGVNGVRILHFFQEHLIQFGGHAQAAGFSVELDRIPALQMAMESLRSLEEIPGVHGEEEDAAYAPLSPGEAGAGGRPDRGSPLPYHLEMPLEQLGWDLMEELERMEPFGPGNPEPLLKLTSVRMETLQYLSEGRHAKFKVVGIRENFSFVTWGKGERIKRIVAEQKPKIWDVVGHLEVNTFMGRESLQFRVEGITVASEA